MKRQHILVQQLCIFGFQTHPFETAGQAFTGHIPVCVRQFFRKNGVGPAAGKVFHQRIGAYILIEWNVVVAAFFADTGVDRFRRGGIVYVLGDHCPQLSADASGLCGLVFIHNGCADALVHRGIQPDPKLSGCIVYRLLQPRLTKSRFELVYKGVSCKLTGQRLAFHVPPAKIRKGFARQLRRFITRGKNRVQVIHHVLRPCHAQTVRQMVEHLMHGNRVVARLTGPHGNVSGPGIIEALYRLRYTVHASGAHRASQPQRLCKIRGNPCRALLRHLPGNRRNTLLLLRGVSLHVFQFLSNLALISSCFLRASRCATQRFVSSSQALISGSFHSHGSSFI